MNEIERNRLLRVKAQILDRPELHAMFAWFCGTTCCIGGQLCVNEGFLPNDDHHSDTPLIECLYVTSPGKGYRVYVGDVASRLIGFIAAPTCLPSQRLPWLFLVENWPAELANRYYGADTMQEYARLSAEAIDLYIEQNFRPTVQQRAHSEEKDLCPA